ncbi:hypothetical protein [Polaromonas sp.]|uniref:hypothetical protein n=1 Tax=Polaromonas sp. TaxID=1869339 RepID=UPI00326690C7
MSWLLAVILSPLWLLYPLYLIGIQALYAKRGGWWRLFYVFLPFTKTAFVLDVAMNYTLLAAYTWDWPQPGEYTFSQRLQRLLYAGGRRASLAWFIKLWMLDWAAPGGLHIKVRP